MRRPQKLTRFMAAVWLSLSGNAFAAYYTGTVDMLEVWTNGNIAFTLNTTGVPCNGQFIINQSWVGAKNFYAMLIAAKTADREVSVYNVQCGFADGTAVNYALVAYLYLP